MPLPLVPILILGAGALIAFAAGKKKPTSSTSTPTYTPTPVYNTPSPVTSITNPTPASSVVVPPGMTQAQVAQGYQTEVIAALDGLGVDPNTYQIVGTPSETSIHYASGVVARMRASGFRTEADTLDKFVQQAIAKRNQTSPTPPIVTVASIPAALQQQLDNAIKYSKDPKVLRNIADALAKLPDATTNPDIISAMQMLNQMANQLESQAIMAQAAQQAGSILSSQTAPTVTMQAPGTTLTNAPGPTTTPGSILNPPAPKSTLETAADLMVSHLKRLQISQGSVTKAKGKEDKNLIKKFQTLAKLTADGKTGPGTLVAAASAGQFELPLVMYWPTGAKAQKVYDYRAALEGLAAKISNTNPTGANQLRASAAREKGQAGIVGGALKD